MSACVCGRSPVVARGMCNTCYRRNRYRQICYGKWQGAQLVSSVGSVRRLRALQAVGYRISDLSTELGSKTVESLVLGTREQVQWETAQCIAELFDRLHATEGPSRLARARARSKGWPPGRFWDLTQIDNPTAKPRGVAA